MITVIAGVNGAGKSSIAGESLRAQGCEYFNPDEVARTIMATDPSLDPNQANVEAWNMGFDMLKKAIDNDDNYTFETTLGGNSIVAELHRAIEQGRQVDVLYCGLNSPELHIQRVQERVTKGGHSIPEEKIRQRWQQSMSNMVGLIPVCNSVTVYDNSTPLNDDGRPDVQCIFSFCGEVFLQVPAPDTPAWAKPLAGAALRRVITVT